MHRRINTVVCFISNEWRGVGGEVGGGGRGGGRKEEVDDETEEMYPEINAIPCGPVFIAFLGGQGISTQHRVRVVVADSDSDCHPLFVSSRDIRLGLPFFSVFLLGLNLFFGLVLLGLKLFLVLFFWV